MTCRYFAVFFATLFSALASASDKLELATEQTLYLPVYSHIYHGNPDRKGAPQQTLVSTHVSIRNTDMQSPIRITSARYFDTRGKLVRSYLSQAITLQALDTHEIFVPLTDTAGGSGANFIITWVSDTPVNPPIVEALHADIREARSLMFITRGHPIRAR